MDLTKTFWYRLLPVALSPGIKMLSSKVLPALENRTLDMQSLGIKATVEEVSDKVVEELQNIFSAKLALAD